MLQLDKIFSREDVAKLIELADGIQPESDFECEIFTYELGELKECNDTQRALFLIEHGRAKQELIASFGRHGCTYFHFKLVISSDGDISYLNMGGCRFRPEKPLEFYRYFIACWEKVQL